MAKLALPLTTDRLDETPDDVDIRDDNGDIIACELTAAQAAFIVTACNAHDELVDAATDYARLIQVENFDRNDMAVHRAYERLRAALARAAHAAQASE